MDYLRGAIGIIVLVLIAFVFSKNKKAIDWKLVGIGILLQLIFGFLVIKVPAVQEVFNTISRGFVIFLDFSKSGAEFIFGELARSYEPGDPNAKHQLGFIFAFQVLPTVIFFSTVSAGLYYLGILQKIVFGIAWVMAKTMRLSGAESLSAEADEVSDKRKQITDLSNLTLQLYSWYINNGHARSRREEEAVTTFFKHKLPAPLPKEATFYQKLYLHQSYCWYAFIRQDFLLYYRHTQKWVDLFDAEPLMIGVETAHYIKGMHNLLNAHFSLRNYAKFDRTLKQFETFSGSLAVQRNQNNTLQVFVYLYVAKINQHFMHGTFKKGLTLVPEIEAGLSTFALQLDRHRVLVFYYKIASLYFGSGNYNKTISYLNKIINWKVDLRNDLQCYARLLHLIAHYELGNYDLLEYLTRSVYRFMAKMQNLSVVEEQILNFLRQSFRLSARQLKPAFEKLLHQLKSLEKNPLEARALAYLDIVAWLESKVTGVPLDEVLRTRYLQSHKKAAAQ